MMTKKLTLTALLIAIAVLFLTVSAIIPTGKLAFFFLSTFVIVIVVMATGVKYAAVAYFATALLSYIFYPGNLAIIAFALFFGYYPILKLYIEKIRNLLIEWPLKLTVFSLALLLLPLFIKDVPWFIFAAAEIAFVIYDLFVSYMIGYITHRFAKVLSQYQ